MLPTNYLSIPQYKCHKVVRAFKIARIDLSPNTSYLIPVQREIAPIPISKHVLENKNPSQGDYYVLYDDGYFSFSPPKAFEDGYSLLEEEAKVEEEAPVAEGESINEHLEDGDKEKEKEKPKTDPSVPPSPPFQP